MPHDICGTRNQIEHLVGKVLPGATCSADPTTGSIAIGVSRQDTIHLPRLFAWLERSRRAAALIREWSISNTTLEQVFLLLCVQNTEVNYVDRRHNVDENICPMCRLRPKEAALLRTLTGQLIVVPASICSECSAGNTMYTVNEEEGLAAGRDPIRINALLNIAQSRAALALTQAALREEMDGALDDDAPDMDGTGSQQEDESASTPLLLAPIGAEECPVVDCGGLSQGGPNSATTAASSSSLSARAVSGSPATQVFSVLCVESMWGAYVFLPSVLGQSHFTQEFGVAVLSALHQCVQVGSCALML